MASDAARLDQLISTTYENYRTKLADNVTKKTALLAALDMKSSVAEDGGRSIIVPLMVGLNNTVKSYSGYDIIDTTPQGGFANAVFEWRFISGALTISGEEELKNAGASRVIGLLEAKFKQLGASFTQTLTDMLWATSVGNGGKDILSVPVIVTNTGTLGGIDSSTETWWQAIVDGGGCNLTTTAGVKKLNTMFNNLSVNGSRPDWEFTTQANFEAYENLAAPSIRFTDTKMADLGFEAIAHKTAEVIFEPKVPAPGGSGGGHWYFLNSEHLQFVKHSQRWMKKGPFQEPIDQDARTAKVLSSGNLTTDERRAHGVITVTTV